MRIYISGPITGHEKTAESNFAAAAESLKAAGHTVVNPMELPHNHDKRWGNYLLEDLAALRDCTAIFMLPGWQSSTGCWVEVYYAKGCGIQILNANIDML